MILTSYTTDPIPNFESILANYGVSIEEGIVVEGDNNHFMSGTPTYVVPDMNQHDITSSIIGKRMPIVIPIGRGLQIADSLESTITIESLLDSTDKSYSKVNANSSTYTKEDADINGPFSLGAAITDNSQEEPSKIVIYSSSYLLDDSMVSLTSLGNTDLFLNSIKWITGNKVNLSIPTRSLLPTYLTLNAADVIFYSALVIIVIPLMILITGAVVTMRRRKK